MKSSLGIFLCVVIFTCMSSAYAVSSAEFHLECFAIGEDEDDCLDELFDDYIELHGDYNQTLASYDESLASHRTVTELLINTTGAEINELESEVRLWKSKYHYVIYQHGNYSLQDQLVNLTERVSVVEEKSSTNEWLIYQLRAVTKALQVDINDIWIKINSVR